MPGLLAINCIGIPGVAVISEYLVPGIIGVIVIAIELLVAFDRLAHGSLLVIITVTLSPLASVVVVKETAV